MKSSAEHREERSSAREAGDYRGCDREAYVTLKKKDAQSYFLTMEKILKTYALLRRRDLFLTGRLAGCRRFEKKITRSKGKGGSLVLKKEPKAIADGFVLVYGAWKKTVR